MSLKLAVFDVDGTLIDSRATILKALQEAAHEVGITEPDYAMVRQIVGLSLVEAIVHMRPDLDAKTTKAYAHAYKERFVQYHADPDFHEPTFEGAHDCLMALKNDGWLMGVATGKSRRGVERMLDVYGWRDVFDCAFCADDGPSKPHPHMLELNLKAVGVDPHQAVMIGDTVHDLNMAMAAKVKAVGVSWGFHTAEELKTAEPLAIIDEFSVLKPLLDQHI